MKNCFIYLKEACYYDELYDRFTVEEGRRLEKFFKQYPDRNGDESKAVVTGVSELWLYFFKGQRFQQKNETIKNWMERDKQRDERLKVFSMKYVCRNCSEEMELIYKFFHTEYIKDKENEYIQCYFACRSCKYSLRIDEFGKQKKIIDSKSNGSQVKDEPLKLVHDLIDDCFEQDSIKFCFTNEEGGSYMEFVQGMKRLEECLNKIDLDPKTKEGSAQYIVDRLERITVVQLRKRISKALNGSGFEYLKFDHVDSLKNNVLISLCAEDLKENRDARLSIDDFKAKIEAVLLYTNWRLMPASTSYKMGILKAKLEGADSDLVLLDWVKRKGLDVKVLPEVLNRMYVLDSEGRKIIL